MPDRLHNKKPNHAWRVEAYEPGFWHALCSCGWVSATRAYTIKTAEQMGREHAVSAAPAVEPEQPKRCAAEECKRGPYPGSEYCGLDHRQERHSTTTPTGCGRCGNVPCCKSCVGVERARIERIIEDHAEHDFLNVDGHDDWIVASRLLAAIRGGDDA